MKNMEKLPFYLNSKTSKSHQLNISASHSEAAVRRCFSKQVLLMLPHIHRKTPVFKSLFNLIKKRLQERCFPVNIAKFLRKAFFLKHRRRLLLALTSTFRNYYWENLSVIFFTLTHPGKRLREAAVRRCFSKVFLKISKIAHETPLLESFVNIAAGLKAYNYTKKRP